MGVSYLIGCGHTNRARDSHATAQPRVEGALTVGAELACVIKSGDAVKCWGSEEQVSRFNLLRRRAARPIRGISISGDGVCLLRDIGDVRCYDPVLGYQDFGRKFRHVRDVQMSNAGVCAIVERGAVDCIWWKSPRRRERIQGIDGVEELEVGGDFACARTRGGSVACWRDGEDRATWTAIRDAIGLAVSNELCVVHLNGSVTCRNEQTGIRRIDAIERATALKNSYGIGCARISDGSLSCWRSRAFPEQPSLPALNDTPLDRAVSVVGINDVRAFDVGSGGLVCSVDSAGRASCFDWRGVIPASKLGARVEP